ncbi:MAG: hypothetical protein ACRD1V_03385 [Vicinamibacterales bacterium]
MKKTLFATSVVLSGLMAAGVYAQQSQMGTSSSNAKVTVTGCVEHGTQSGATGTTGTTGSTATSGTSTTANESSLNNSNFVLTNVSNSNSSSTAAGSTATSATPASSEASTASEYSLNDSGQNRLSQYVGQKVEVKGSVENQSSYSGSSTTGSTASSSSSSTANQAASGASSSQPTLKVDSIRMIASTCAGSTR